MEKRRVFLVWPETTNARELKPDLSAQEIWDRLNADKEERVALGVSRPPGNLPEEIITIRRAHCYDLDGKQKERSLLLIEPTDVDEVEKVLTGSDIQVRALAAPTG